MHQISIIENIGTFLIQNIILVTEMPLNGKFSLPPASLSPETPQTISTALLFTFLLNTGVLEEAQTSLELRILPPSPPECWGYWCVPCLSLIFSLDGYSI